MLAIALQRLCTNVCMLEPCPATWWDLNGFDFLREAILARISQAALRADPLNVLLLCLVSRDDT